MKEQILNDDRKQELKKLAGAYADRYSLAMDEFIAKGEPNMDKLVDIAWDNMVMGRIASPIEEERNARKELRKEVWEGEIDDPELFVRIYISLAQAQESSRRNWTASGGGFAAGAVYQTTRRLIISKSDLMKKLFPSCYGEKAESPDVLFAAELMVRAQKELARVAPDKKITLIPWGAHGFHQGVPVEVDRYSADGLIWLKPIAGDDPSDFFQKIGTGSVSGLEINPADFELPKAPDHFEGVFQTYPGPKGIIAASFRVFADLDHQGIVYDRDEVSERLGRFAKDYPQGGIKVKIIYNYRDGVHFKVAE